MQNILVPTDLSRTADVASDTAILLAKRIEAKVIYLHLIESRGEEIHLHRNQVQFGKKVFKEVSAKSKIMEKYLEMAKKEKVLAEPILNYDRSYSSILEFVDANQVSLIIMGTHGITGLKELFKGSHSQKIARFSDVPVLVVKEGYVNKKMNQVVFVSDFKDHPGDGYRTATRLTRMMGMKLHLVFINTPGHFTTQRQLHERMNDYVKGYRDIIVGQELFNAYEIEEGIEEYCQYHDVDIVAMVTHHRNKASGLINNFSLTEKLVNHLKLPVLTLHD